MGNLVEAGNDPRPTGHTAARVFGLRPVWQRGNQVRMALGTGQPDPGTPTRPWTDVTSSRLRWTTTYTGFIQREEPVG